MNDIELATQPVVAVVPVFGAGPAEGTRSRAAFAA